MTTTTETPVPSFHVRARGIDLARGLALLALCATLAAGLVAQVWHAPDPAERDATAATATAGTAGGVALSGRDELARP
jgi:hypothetical protein